MKSINKTLFIFTALSKILCCSDAMQTSPRMPDPARGGVLTYDDVLGQVIRTGFALRVVGLEMTPLKPQFERNKLDFEIKEIEDSFWRMTWSLWNMYKEEFDFKWDDAFLIDDETYAKRIKDLEARKTKVLNRVYNKCSLFFKEISPCYHAVRDPKDERLILDPVLLSVTSFCEKPYEDFVGRIRPLVRKFSKLSKTEDCTRQCTMLRLAARKMSMMFMGECSYTLAVVVVDHPSYIFKSGFSSLAYYPGLVDKFIEEHNDRKNYVFQLKERCLKEANAVLSLVSRSEFPKMEPLNFCRSFCSGELPAALPALPAGMRTLPAGPLCSLFVHIPQLFP